MKLKNGLELSISKAIKEDAKALIEYLNIVGGESDNLLFGKHGFHMSAEDEERYIEHMKDAKASALLVGKINGEIVCVGSIQAPGRERISHQADIAVSVKKAYWNIGIGTELMKTLIVFAKQSGVTEVLHLGVRADNFSAIRLYENVGFRKIGVYEKFFKINGNYHDEILMNLYL
jgi:RimJ/RimL family protein N-acetyltransferase